MRSWRVHPGVRRHSYYPAPYGDRAEARDVTATADPRSSVDDYFDVLRREQARFLDAIAEARLLLIGSGRVAHAAAIQAQLARRFLDAQRSILRRRAEVEAEFAALAGGKDLEVDEPDGAEATRQLAALLDDWWRAENQSGRRMMDAARAYDEVCPSAFETSSGPTCAEVGVAQLSAEMISALDAADPADLASLLTTLDDLLEPSPAEEARHEGRPVDDDVIIWLPPIPIGAQTIGASWSR
jgi:hypothetical protein